MSGEANNPAEPWPLAGDPRFFARSGPHDLATIAQAGAARVDQQFAGRLIRGVASLQAAGPEHVSFLDNRRYLPELAASRAGAVIIQQALAAKVPAGAAAVRTEEPYLAWAKIVALFHPAPAPTPGIDPSARVAASCSIGAGVAIGAFAVVGERAEIGAGCRIGAHAVIGDGVVLGPDCRIGAHASVSHTLAGARVVIFPGARIGQEGFGFAQSATGFVSVPQLGRVILEDDVEVGANTTVDRGSVQDTVIGAGSRLDNLVQIGHNVRLGRACVVVSQVGISGSTVVEDFVMIGGQAGLVGHLSIGRGARIGGQAGVMADVPAGSEVVGSPAMPVRSFFRQVVALRRLAGIKGRGDAG